MMQAARKASPANGPLSGGFAGSMYQGLADEEFSRAAAAVGGFGLGDAVYQQMATRLSGRRAYARAASAGAAGAQGTVGKSDN
jgi:Rod binding domain-containing protein